MACGTIRCAAVDDRIDLRDHRSNRDIRGNPSSGMDKLPNRRSFAFRMVSVCVCVGFLHC